MAATTATTPTTPYASASLYIGDLVPEVTEALLFEVFNTCGPVASVRVCRDAATRRSLGYAYVNFHHLEDAERSLDTMNFKPISGQPCRIMWSHRDPSLRKSGLGNIFVKNLAPTTDNKTLFDTFSLFGNILSCKVAQNSKRESLGYGFVHFESGESAQEAIAKRNGTVVDGQELIVTAFKSKKERGGANKFRFTNVYVKNLPEDLDEKTLETMFAEHGEISSCMIAQKDGASRGFGFVNFATPEGASAAVEALNDFEVSEKKLFVCRAQKKDEREKELRERFENLKAERQKKYELVNLYVKNLSDSIDDDRLREEFKKFGSITSARVMRDANNKSRGFGFVCFSSADEATKAVTEMSNRMVDAKPLYVALAQRKEVRRVQLEAQHAARAKLGIPQGHQMNGGFPPHSPMFYQTPVMGGQRVMYPQQVMRQFRQPQPHHMMVNRGGGGGQYQMIPANMGGGRGRGNQRGARGNRQRGPNQGQGPKRGQQQGGMHQGDGQVQYNNNVRNRNTAQPAAQAAVEPAPAQQTSNQSSFHAVLLQAPEEARKQLIGEQLFPLITAKLAEGAEPEQQQYAPKITGMLLEMENSELLILLGDRDALSEKIDEAFDVLRSHDDA